METDRQHRTPNARPGRAHVWWASFVVAGFALILGGAALSEPPEGTCSGIGFGCELAGPDLALLMLIFVGPLVLGVLLAGHIAIGAAHAIVRRTERRDAGSIVRLADR